MTDSRLVGPVRLTIGGFDDCVDLVVDTALRREPMAVHFVNAYSIALADSHPQYAELLNTGLCFTDGVPVTWVGRRIHRVPVEKWPRVYGPDVMAAVLDRGHTHYLLGGTPSTLRALRQAIGVRWPGAQVLGAESPPFRTLTDAELAAQDRRVTEAGAQFVWVGLGTPKQDWEAARLAGSAGCTALAVGAAFDFLAGTKPQAPGWMQKSGTEWAFRLASEPSRLVKRYLWGNPRFVMAALRTGREFEGG